MKCPYCHTVSLLIAISLLCFSSCEDDYMEDRRCIPDNGIDIDDWEDKGDTIIHHNGDTINGSIEVTIEDWQDSTNTTIEIK